MTRYKAIPYQVNVPESLEAFKNWTFSSGGTTGIDFKRFAQLFRNHIKKHLPENAKLVNFSKGHYYVSGFIEKNGNYIYFSVSDVRFFPNEWNQQILIRTAEHEKDYTGGSNEYTTLEQFKENVSKLLTS